MAAGGGPELVPCLCKFCVQSEVKPAAECVLEKRVKQHMSDVAALVRLCPTVKLIVRPEKAEFSCHKILLSFYSTSFDNDIYGTTKGTNTDVFNFPACSKQEMDAFVSWLYSGRLDRKPNQRLPCLLWTFCQKFGAPLFANDAMQLLSDTIRTEALNVSTTKFVYANTPANSMLRLFIAEYITHANPLDPRFTKSLAIDRQRAYRTEWVNLVAKGGDFMRDVAELGLHNKNEKQAPWRSENLYKFLEKEPDRSPASWNRGKVSVNSNRQEAPERRQHVGEQRGMKRTSGAEEQLATKKQKESDDRTPTKQKESKDQTPTRQSDQLPTRQNAQTSNRQYWQTLVRQHGQTPTRQTNQTPPRERTQTPTRHNQSPYTPPFRVPHTAADVTDTNSLTDDDTPLRVRRAGL